MVPTVYSLISSSNALFGKIVRFSFLLISSCIKERISQMSFINPQFLTESLSPVSRSIFASRKGKQTNMATKKCKIPLQDFCMVAYTRCDILVPAVAGPYFAQCSHTPYFQHLPTHPNFLCLQILNIFNNFLILSIFEII